MKLRHITIFFALLILLSGCARQEVVPESVRSTLESIASVDVRMDRYLSYAEYHKQVHEEIEAAIRPPSSASELNTLFVECYRRWRTAPELPQEKLQWIDPNHKACDAILFRLAELNSEEATKVLVDLYANNAFRWDGEFSLNASHAISRCGKLALPYLARADFGDRSTHIQTIIQHIEKGELYGP